MVKVEIQEATDKDLSLILSLFKQSDMDNNKVLSVEQAKRIFNRIKSYSSYRIYVAKAGDEVVGTLSLLIMDKLAHLGAPSGIVEDVVVRKDWQGKGIGKKMMKFAIDLCQKIGCYKLMLSSDVKRGIAHNFYEKLGFKKHGYSFVVHFAKDDKDL
jgi:GNAT superfamily N-acetyltransferase